MTTKQKKPAETNTQRADAKHFGVTPRTIRDWRDKGAPGFLPNGSVGDRAALAAWIETELSDREGTRDSKERKLLEEIRKLRMANDAKEGRLVERAWVAERMQRTAGELNNFRAKSEAEHPMRFAAAAGDVAGCREIIRGIWSEIFKAHAALAKYFEPAAK